MGNPRRLRRLVVGTVTWRWSVHHRRGDDSGEVLTLHREATGGRLRIVFRPGPGRLMSDALWQTGSVGCRDSGAVLNLHEPNVVRRLLDAAAARGALTGLAGRAEREVDGWPLFAELVDR
ncbi:hypothetical protein ACFZB9_34825 [Kitasatospora sp. NPDC008050]|uniref:hypothetical protein n=1 Tax=Kitasatospora sp. NPDC008050 TaxID=3364021 RepID=UPI0036E5ACED